MPGWERMLTICLCASGHLIESTMLIHEYQLSSAPIHFQRVWEILPKAHWLSSLALGVVEIWSRFNTPCQRIYYTMMRYNLSYPSANEQGWGRWGNRDPNHQNHWWIPSLDHKMFILFVYRENRVFSSLWEPTWSSTFSDMNSWIYSYFIQNDIGYFKHRAPDQSMPSACIDQGTIDG